MSAVAHTKRFIPFDALRALLQRVTVFLILLHHNMSRVALIIQSVMGMGLMYKPHRLNQASTCFIQKLYQNRNKYATFQA